MKPVRLMLPGGTDVPITLEGWRLLSVHLTLDGLVPTPAELPTNIDGKGAFTPGSPGYLWRTVPVGETWFVAGLSPVILGSGAFSIAGYGPLPALTNGIKIYIKNGAPGGPGAVWHDFSEGVPLRTESDLGGWFSSVEYVAHGGGPNALRGQYNIMSHASPVVVPSGYSFVVELRDDLTAAALIQHRFHLQGLRVGDESVL